MYFIKMVPVLTAPTEVSGCKSPGMPHFYAFFFSSTEDQLYFGLFCLEPERRGLYGDREVSPSRVPASLQGVVRLGDLLT